MTVHLDAETLRTHLEAFFFDWRTAAGSPSLLCYDGPVNLHDYARADRRVVYVLKEANVLSEANVETDEAEWNLCKYLRDGGRGLTWNNVARWTQAIIKGAAWEQIATIEAADRPPFLREIAVMNLNKGGGRSKTNPAQLRSAANGARHLLRRQLEILDPHVVICGGAQTGNLAGDIMFGLEPDEWEKVAAGVRVAVGPKVGARSVITMPHPQARRRAKEMFDGLMAAIGRCQLKPATDTNRES